MQNHLQSPEITASDCVIITGFHDAPSCHCALSYVMCDIYQLHLGNILNSHNLSEDLKLNNDLSNDF